MGWLYHILSGCDVFVLKNQVQSQDLTGVAATDIFWFNEKENVWEVSPLNQFRPPEEKEHQR